jgi:ATP-dependent helicase/DNAse subunit B
VTGFKGFIESPYAYWLEHVLGLRNSCSGAGVKELSLDPLQFGSLLHEALAQLMDPKIKDCEDSKTLKDFLAAWIRTKVAKQFGKHPKAGIILQVDTAIKWIESAIEWHLADRAEGWILQAA